MYEVSSVLLNKHQLGLILILIPILADSDGFDNTE